ncbi:hypothetical protein [Verrucosispora sp. WMMD1129]|uniref:hypothetical protein n=1 Tax=Verrucosispora sp. WMMD1129 TaxID=3016093 RepID=UPI00249C33C9|nr:hypothetical protein [Verrucosispora sp. WMMD1129]WFE45331.1 hypothetical protein O7624_13700 [Verrucosispora sp. WMMD1129]
MTTTTPARIGTLRYLAADWQTRLFGPDHPGADTGWITALRATNQPEQAERPAIASAPHVEVHDPHLGVLRIAVSEPARIYEALAGVR